MMPKSIDAISWSIEVDCLFPLFANFAVSARVFYSGRLCGASGDHDTKRAGHLHVFRRGRLRIVQEDGRSMVIEQPGVLFYPRPLRHRFIADDQNGAEIVCARIEFGAGMLNPLTQAFPEMLVVPLESIKELGPTVELFFNEAFGELAGRQTALDRLAEYFLVLLLRVAMDAKLVDRGVLMGLADARLAQALHAMHQRPEHAWSLEELAREAGMSRPRFAVHFRRTIGSTAFDYLTDWRLGLAQTLLKKGQSLKIVAPAVGFASSAALSRAFSRRIGTSPSEWLARESSITDEMISDSEAREKLEF
jgi:AraC-like DNA-binding protein